MKTNKKHSLIKRVLAGIAGIVALLFVTLFIATWFLNREPYQDKIRQAAEAHTKNMARFEHVTIALLPRPHVTATNGTVVAKMKGTVQSASVYPEILPLLLGKFRIAKIVLTKPDLTVTVREEAGAAAAEDAQSAFAETRSDIESVVKSVRAVAPYFTSEVIDGAVAFKRNNRVIADLSRISGTVSLIEKGFEVAATAEAPYWGHVAVQGALSVGKHSLAVKHFSLSGGRSAMSQLTARFGWRTTPYLHIESGQGVIVLHDIYERRRLFPSLTRVLNPVKTMRGSVKFSAMSFRGPLLHPDRWQMDITGGLEDIAIESASLPGPIRIAQGDFTATAENVSFSNLRGTVIDSSLTASLSVDGLLGTVSSADASLDGTIGRETVKWITDTFRVPRRFIVRTPLTLSGVHVGWKRGPTLSLAGTIEVKKGPTITIDATGKAGRFSVRRMIIRDVGGQASLTLTTGRKFFDFTFRGSLNEITVSRLFEHASLAHGWIRGALQGRIFLERPHDSTASGLIEAGELPLDFARLPVIVKHLVLQANNRTAAVTTGAFVWDSTPFDLTGTIKAAADGFRLDMDLAAESLSLELLHNSISSSSTASANGGNGSGPGFTLPFGGYVRVNTKQFTVGRYSLSPFHAVVSLAPPTGKPRVTVTDAELCGISVPGTIDETGGNIRLSLKPDTSDQELGPALICLFGKDRHITGTFSFAGTLDSTGKSGELVRALQGHVDFSAKDGTISRAPILSRIFALLNVTELLRGKLPDLTREAIQYKSAKITGDIKNGKLMLHNASLEGKTLNLAAEGEIDLAANTMDVTVLVAPFKTLEYILSKIPLLRNILANKLVTVPVRVSGDLSNPDITPLDPKAIGQNLLDIMKGILELPFKVLQPLFK